jgi:hypothetical protein
LQKWITDDSHPLFTTFGSGFPPSPHPLFLKLKIKLEGKIFIPSKLPEECDQPAGEDNSVGIVRMLSVIKR